jgi:hypothetical protein
VAPYYLPDNVRFGAAVKTMQKANPVDSELRSGMQKNIKENDVSLL